MFSWEHRRNNKCEIYVTATAIDSKVVVVIYNIADSALGKEKRPASAVWKSENHLSSTILKNREDDFHSPIL